MEGAGAGRAGGGWLGPDRLWPYRMCQPNGMAFCPVPYASHPVARTTCLRVWARLRSFPPTTRSKTAQPSTRAACPPPFVDTHTPYPQPQAPPPSNNPRPHHAQAPVHRHAQVSTTASKQPGPSPPPLPLWWWWCAPTMNSWRWGRCLTCTMCSAPLKVTGNEKSARSTDCRGWGGGTGSGFGARGWGGGWGGRAQLRQGLRRRNARCRRHSHPGAQALGPARRLT